MAELLTDVRAELPPDIGADEEVETAPEEDTALLCDDVANGLEITTDVESVELVGDGI